MMDEQGANLRMITPEFIRGMTIASFETSPVETREVMIPTVTAGPPSQKPADVIGVAATPHPPPQFIVSTNTMFGVCRVIRQSFGDVGAVVEFTNPGSFPGVRRDYVLVREIEDRWLVDAIFPNIPGDPVCDNAGA